MKKLILLLIFQSCVIDKTNEIIFVKNDSKKNVFVFIGYENVPDSLVAYSAPQDIHSGESGVVYKSDIPTTNKDGKFVFVLLDMDTAVKYVHAGALSGLSRKAFLYKNYAKMGDTIVFR